jgi:hypothetical protein
MKTLSTVPMEAPEKFPDLPVAGMVTATAHVIPKKGEGFYVCNPMDEIIAARESGEPFVAHAVIGMKPKRVIIEPGTLARIEEC